MTPSVCGALKDKKWVKKKKLIVAVSLTYLNKYLGNDCTDISLSKQDVLH